MKNFFLIEGLRQVFFVNITDEQTL